MEGGLLGNHPVAAWGRGNAGDLPAVRAFDQSGGGSLLTGGGGGDFGEGDFHLRGVGPVGNAGHSIVIIDGVLGGVGIGRREAVDGSDLTMAEAEISITGLGWIRGPRGAAFIREIVIVDLLGSDRKRFFSCGVRTSITARVGEGVEAFGLIFVVGVGLSGKFNGRGPDADGLRAVVVVERRFEGAGVDSIFAASCSGDDEGRAARHAIFFVGI